MKKIHQFRGIKRIKQTIENKENAAEIKTKIPVEISYIIQKYDLIFAPPLKTLLRNFVKIRKTTELFDDDLFFRPTREGIEKFNIFHFEYLSKELTVYSKTFDVINLVHLKNLRNVTFDGTEISNSKNVSLKQIITLKLINISINFQKFQDLIHNCFPNLIEIDIFNIRCSSTKSGHRSNNRNLIANIVKFLGASRICSCKIQSDFVSDGDIELLKHKPCVRLVNDGNSIMLDMNKTYTLQNDLKIRNTIHKVQKFDFTDIFRSFTFFPQTEYSNNMGFVCAQQLEDLKLSNENVSNFIDYIDLTGYIGTDKMILAFLSQFKRIKHLILRSTKLSEISIMQLSARHRASLQTLDISHIEISQSTFSYLQSLLKNCVLKYSDDKKIYC